MAGCDHPAIFHRCFKASSPAHQDRQHSAKTSKWPYHGYTLERTAKIGEYINSNGVRCYEPDSSETELHIEIGDWGKRTVKDYLDIAARHFPEDVDLENLIIHFSHTQIRHLESCDYDPEDYKNYLSFKVPD